MRTRNPIVLSALAVLVASGLGACAAGPLPPATALRPGDLARLGGTWLWTARTTPPSRFGAGAIKVRVAGGRMQFDSASSSGTLTLHEDGGRRVLAGEGRSKRDGASFSVELTQRGRPAAARGPAAGVATPAPAFVFVLDE